jgi:hypothetical protein
VRTIWKFQLHITDEQQVSMPRGSVILCVQSQAGQPCLWAVVDSDAPLEARTIHIFGTGLDMGDPATVPMRGYIGTFQMAGGALVWHVFEPVGKELFS